MNVPSPADEARRWPRFAQEDLKAAEAVAATGELAPHIGCYHAQQAAEKALKAILVYLQTRFPFRHDLDELRELIPQGWDITRVHPDLSALSQWVTEGRYPGNWPEPTESDASNAARQARAVWETIVDDLERHGLDVSAYR
jgi:HEPN domain-containing protein